jgi:hypothetical protein
MSARPTAALLGDLAGQAFVYVESFLSRPGTALSEPDTSNRVEFILLYYASTTLAIGGKFGSTRRFDAQRIGQGRPTERDGYRS